MSNIGYRALANFLATVWFLWLFLTKKKFKCHWNFYILAHNFVTKHRTYSKPYFLRILMIRRTRWHAFQLDWSKLIFRSLYKSAFFKFEMAAICKRKKWRQLDSGRGGFEDMQNSHKKYRLAKKITEIHNAIRYKLNWNKIQLFVFPTFSNSKTYFNASPILGIFGLIWMHFSQWFQIRND